MREYNLNDVCETLDDQGVLGSGGILENIVAPVSSSLDEKITAASGNLTARITNTSSLLSGAIVSTSSSLDSRIGATSGGLQTQLDGVSGGLAQRPTSSGAEQIASEVVESGGYAKSMTEVVSGGSVGYIPVLSGGVCYRFTDPLTVLSIGSITSSLQESDILFTAGAVISPAPEIKVKYQTGVTWENDDEVGGDVEFPVYSAFTLTSSGAGYSYTVPSNLPWYEWGHGDEPEANNGSGWLSGGSFTCTSGGGKWVISAHGVTEFMHRLDHDDDITTSRIIDTWLASSTDGMTTWTVNTAQGARLYAQWFDDFMTWDIADVDASPEIDAAPVPTPCDVILPSGTLLVNSSAVSVESGHRYEMNIKHGAIVTGEWQEIGE